MLLLVTAGCGGHPPPSDKPHHTKSGFRNLYIHHNAGSFDFLKWRFQRIGLSVPGPEDYDFPLNENDRQFLKNNQDKITLTWIGHATVMLRINGKTILTDPHFSDRASPVSWAGPKRVTRPGILLKDLPHVDMVLISHNHYDHLDKETVKALHNRPNGDRTRFFVPLKLKKWFQDQGIENVSELDWWENRAADGITITAVPVQHWSKRSMFSRNKSLWCGWVVNTDNFKFFFAADTGYCPIFKQIGEKLGPFDLSAIPIGAYEPRWFMKPHHVNPEEAIMIHQDVMSKQSVAIHWGTFILTDEPLDEPLKRLKSARKAKNIPESSFAVLKHGETIILDK